MLGPPSIRDGAREEAPFKQDADRRFMSMSAAQGGRGGHKRVATTGSTSSVSGPSYSRRVPSQSSVASSGTAYSSTRGSYAGSSSGNAGSGSSSSTAHLESTVTKLLVSTKQLLEGLTEWSLGKISEEQVSDIYVRLGNCFNAAVAAFTREGINMRCVGLTDVAAIRLMPLPCHRDLKEVPQLLRVRLEAAINEEASAATLHEHLPKIRPIILDLLRGLREKQDQHQAMLAVQARTASDSERSGSVSNPAYHPSQASGPSRRQDSISSHDTSRESNGLAADHGPTNGRISPNSQVIHGHTVSRPSSRTAHHVGFSESDPSSINRRPSIEMAGLGARQPSNAPRPGSLLKSRSASNLRQSGAGATPPPEAPLPPLPPSGMRLVSGSSVSTAADTKPSAIPSSAPRLLQIPDIGAVSTPPVPRMGPLPGGTAGESTPPSLQPPLPQPSAFSTPPRSSLRPMPSVWSTNHNSTSAGPSSVPDDASLEALKKADPLARRASKRFSAYTFSKISSSNLTGSASSPGGLGMTGLGLSTPVRGTPADKDDSAREYISQNAAGTVDKASRKPKKGKSPRINSDEPPVPALPPLKDLPALSFSSDNAQPSQAMQTPRKKRVSVVTEETEDQLEADERGDQAQTAGPSGQDTLTPQVAEQMRRSIPRSGSSTSIASIASTASAYSNVPESSSHPLPIAPSQAPQLSEPQTPGPPQTIFLQLGRDMKRANLDSSTWPTFANLRTLFTDKFAYNPGLADFPSIYLRDPSSGVQYELEDVEEIKNNSVLSLNIERS